MVEKDGKIADQDMEDGHLYVLMRYTYDGAIRRHSTNLASKVALAGVGEIRKAMHKIKFST